MNSFEQALISLSITPFKNIPDENGAVFGKSSLAQNLYGFLKANGNQPDATDIFQQFYQNYGKFEGSFLDKLNQSTLKFLSEKFAETIADHKEDYLNLGIPEDTFDKTLSSFSEALPLGIAQSPYAVINGLHSKLGLDDIHSKEAITLYPSGSFIVHSDKTEISILDVMCQGSELAQDMVTFVRNHIEDCDTGIAGKYRLPDNEIILKLFIFDVMEDEELLENPIKTIEDGVLAHLAVNVEAAFEAYICAYEFEKDGQVLTGFELLEQHDDFKPEISVGADGDLMVNDRSIKDFEFVLSGLKGQFCSQMEVEPHFPQNDLKNTMKP